MGGGGRVDWVENTNMTGCISTLYTLINTCRKVPLQVNFCRWRHFALVYNIVNLSMGLAYPDNHRGFNACYFKLTVPLLTLWVFGWHVDESHVEEGWEDEGEEGDGGAAHQVQDGPEVGQRLRDEQQAEYGDWAKQHALPVECCKETIKLERPLNPFLFIKKRLFISSESFSILEKNTLICYQRAICPVGCEIPLQMIMAVWYLFCLKSNFLGRGWQPSAKYNGAARSHYYLQRAVTPDQITQQNSFQRSGPLKEQKRPF